MKGDSYAADFSLDTLAVNGKYTLKLKSADGKDEYTTTFDVINYPLSVDGVYTINAVGKKATTFKQDTVVRINADLKNSGKTTVTPTVIVQVKDAEGAVVYFAEANDKSINSGAKNRYSFDIPLENFEKGSYTAEIFAWDQMDNPIPLTGKSTSKTYIVN